MFQRFLLISCLLWAALFLTNASKAQSSIEPYFMVILDNSGSMAWSPGSTNNSCGVLTNRMSDAKCVLQRVVGGYGEVSFGLERFEDTCTSGTCTPSCVTSGCGCTGCSSICNDTASSAEVLVPIAEDNQNELLKWIDFTCNTCGESSSGSNNPEIYARVNTPLAGSLLRAQSYFQGASGPLFNDTAFPCRPVNVILLTDGEETCGGNPSAAATALRTTVVNTAFGARTYDIRTYVIGFGIAAGNAQIESIATSGGTDAPGAHRGFYASDETSLALAFSQIVSESIRTESCDNSDNDCDTRVDEGFVKYCNVPGGTPGLALCTDPGETVCNGIDDNCDGRTDEGLTNACGTCGPAPAEICDGIDNDCDRLTDEGGVCGSCIRSTEICDNMDNDCDGTVDMIVRNCGVDTGECSPGTQTCVGGVWGMCSNVGPTPEVCDGLDNDCNGVIDGMSRPCGSDVGVCEFGRQICTLGSWGTCTGGIASRGEICDANDNDCDARTDEGTGGGTCGSAEGFCETGTNVCRMGMLVCEGGVGPSTEICDNIDNDCDGVIDDGIPVGAPCGTDVGECSPGVNICRDGMLICDGAFEGSMELCNNLDDDCDSNIDEGIASEECGMTEGLCMPGMTQCIGGVTVCSGEVPPGIERCDCSDNDCDGSIDEGGDSLCGAGTRCLDCQCAGPCMASEVAPCAVGRVAVTRDGMCYCIAETCDPAVCAGETVTVDDEVRCGPDAAGVTTCVCKENECTFACADVICSDGTVCDPRDALGRCVEPSCRGLGCLAGELCNSVSGECEPDRCTNVMCNEGEACRQGVCEASCATVECPLGQSCRAGVCQSDACAGIVCSQGQYCDNGSCVMGMCADVICGAGRICDPRTGMCVLDPCFELRCPPSQYCEDGQCKIPPTSVTPDAGVEDNSKRVALSGGRCSLGTQGRAPSMLVFLLMLAALLIRKEIRA